LVVGASGALYGTILPGEDSNAGSLYTITTNGLIAILETFGTTNGANPACTIFKGSDGALYGTAARGGSRLGGNIFKFSLGSPFQSSLRTTNNSSFGFNPVPELRGKIVASQTTRTDSLCDADRSASWFFGKFIQN
jgi:hypothetical protein